jgi:hypothetical protein
MYLEYPVKLKDLPRNPRTATTAWRSGTNSDLPGETRLMYSGRSAEELKADVVVVVEVMVVGLDEADLEVVVDAVVAVVVTPLLSTDLSRQWTVTTALYQHWRRTTKVMQHLLLIQPFRILEELRQYRQPIRS